MIAHCTDHAVVHFGWMGGHESEAMHAADPGNGRKECAEVATTLRTAIGVDRLAEELDFRPAGADRATHFRQNVVQAARNLASARGRDDAERAVLVAALDDGDL